MLVALVRPDPERVAAASPPSKLRLQLLTGRQVPFFAVGVEQVEVVELVSSLIARIKDAAVRGKERNRQCRVRRRRRHRHGRATRHRDAVDVEDAGLVRGEENLLLVR